MYFGSVIHLNRTGIIVLCTLVFIWLLYTISNGQQAKYNDKINLKLLLEAAIKASENGGLQVVAVKDHLNIKSKGLTKEGVDDSVTTADFRSHCSIMETLTYYFPKLQIISEESVENCKKINESQLERNILENLPDEFVDIGDVTVWIDPLDATKEYTEKLYDYVTTMVCVAVKGQPIIGVVHKPFSKTTSWGWVGKKVSKDLHNLLKNNRDKMKVIISRSHKGQIESILSKNFNNYETVIAAGAGYKVLEVAKHHVDAYVHITAIKKWDICAGNAIIKTLGGEMTTKSGKVINYSNTDNVLNENGLVVTSSNYYHDLFVVCLSGVGDVLEQHYEMLTDKLPKWNEIRTKNMCCSGATVGLVCHYWYKYLDRIIPGYTVRIVLKKIFLDQIIGSPLYISTFFLTIGYMEGANFDDIFEEAKNKAWKLYLAEWMIWPPAQFINFYLLSTKYRVLFDNTLSLGYDVYTSKVKHDSEDKSRTNS